MHVHAAQFDLMAQTQAYAARAEAKMAVERTRKKLINFASALAGDFDDPADCVVRLGEEGTPQDQSDQEGRHGETSPPQQRAQVASESDTFSGWA
jgi:hypothetical protein